MTISHISTTPFNGTSGFLNVFNQAATAVAGDKIVVGLDWKQDSGQTITSITWNGQSLAIEGSEYAGIGGRLAHYSVIASSSATADVIITFGGGGSGYCYCNAYVLVARDSAVGNISLSTIQAQKYDGTVAYADPSLTNTSVPVGAISINALFATAYDKDFNPLTGTTWTGSDTARGNIQNTNGNTGRLYIQSAAGAGSNITHTYTPSVGAPMYNNFVYYLTSSPAYSIDSITNPLLLGSSGNTINTSSLGTLTSLTIGGKAVSSLSAPSGDGTFSIPAWADGVQGFLLGSSQAVIAGDGTNTASSTVTVSQQAGYSLVTLTSVNTGAGYLGNQVSLSVGDQIIFPIAASLGTTTNYIDVDGGIYTDYAGSQILYKRNNTTGIVTQITLINGQVAPSKFALLWFFGM